MKKILLLALVLLLLCPLVSFADNQHNMAGIQFKIPNGWTASSNINTISISKNDKKELLLVGNMSYKDKLPELSEIKAVLKEMGNKTLSRAVEKDLVLHEFNRGQVKGYYFSLTDKAPKPGEFEYMTQGEVISDRLFIIFTALSNESRDPSDEVLAMVASMKPGK